MKYYYDLHLHSCLSPPPGSAEQGPFLLGRSESPCARFSLRRETLGYCRRVLGRQARRLPVISKGVQRSITAISTSIPNTCRPCGGEDMTPANLAAILR